MPRFFHTASSLVLTAVFLLSGYTAQHGQAKEKSITTLQPKSGWAVTRIDGQNPQTSYCALARPYEQDLVVTLGRNVAEEYSIAIDFQTAKLNTEKAYNLILQPSPGQIRAYEMMPASEQAMVIRLGYDDSFFKALQQSELLKAEIDGVNYHFSMPDVGSGQADLKKCMAGLTGKSETKTASGFSAEKIANAPPMEPMETSGRQIITEKIIKEVLSETPAGIPKEFLAEISKEDLKEEGPTEAVKIAPAPVMVKEAAREVTREASQEVLRPVKDITADVAEKTTPPIKISRVSSKIIDPVAPTKIARIANKAPAPSAHKMVSEPPSESKKAIVSKIPSEIKNEIVSEIPRKTVSKEAVASRKIVRDDLMQQTALQKQQRTEMQQLKEDNKRLALALQTEVRNKASSASPILPPPVLPTLPPPVVPDRSGEVQALQAEVEELKTQKQADLEKIKAENEKLKASVQSLAIQNKIKAQEKAEEAVKTAAESNVIDPEVVRQLDNLKAENKRLSSALQGQEKEIAAFDSASPEAERELAQMHARVRDLEEENKKYYQDAKQARGQIDTAVVDAGNQAFKKIRTYEKKLEAAQADNLTLSKEIEEMRRLQEDGRLNVVAGDWDLEKSTKRYNEAEREIKRLGLLLEQQRTVHRQERMDLEQMLFDPAVSDREQRKRLSDLEQKLAAAESQLRSRGAATASSSVYSRPPREEHIAVASSVRPAAIAPAAKPAVASEPLRAVARQPIRAAPVVQPVAPREPVSRAPISRARISRAPVSRAPIPQAPLSRSAPSPSSAVSQPSMAAAVSANAFNEGQLQQLLSRSGVSIGSGIKKIAGGQYRWGAGKLTGHAQVVSSAQGIDQFAQNYIAKIKQSCGGDFASIPSDFIGSAKGYEVACISSSRSTSSSIVFTKQGRDLIAIAHETSADDMDVAMDARDKIAANL